ncbi:MAG: hypothetical protein ABW034_21585 [Steroidobacteraceae bacterium]
MKTVTTFILAGACVCAVVALCAVLSIRVMLGLGVLGCIIVVLWAWRALVRWVDRMERRIAAHIVARGSFPGR